MNDPVTLPVLPLRELVLYPGTTSPISAGRPGTLRAIETALRLEHGLPAVRGSSHDLQQLLVNLILNAVDAMPKGGRLTISTAPHIVDPPGVEIRVEDTGEGIARENLRRIFDPFFTTREPGRGTGLGLSICSRIVESMAGRIEVESEPGRGSAFTVVLPAAPTANPG